MVPYGSMDKDECITSSDEYEPVPVIETPVRVQTEILTLELADYPSVPTAAARLEKFTRERDAALGKRGFEILVLTQQWKHGWHSLRV
eukprot:SAG31_NODE_264_length_18835_cov_7.543553_15_plen_88_part_00